MPSLGGGHAEAARARTHGAQAEPSSAKTGAVTAGYGQNRRGRRQWSASTVDDETSAVEQADADSRACAATEPDGIASHIQGQSMEPAHARCDGQC